MRNYSIHSTLARYIIYVLINIILYNINIKIVEVQSNHNRNAINFFEFINIFNYYLKSGCFRFLNISFEYLIP